MTYGEGTKYFSASSSYQLKFCDRFGLRKLAICSEMLSANSPSAETFINSFPDIFAGFSKDQIFNCDETGPYYKMLRDHLVIFQ